MNAEDYIYGRYMLSEDSEEVSEQFFPITWTPSGASWASWTSKSLQHDPSEVQVWRKRKVSMDTSDILRGYMTLWHFRYVEVQVWVEFHKTLQISYMNELLWRVGVAWIFNQATTWEYITCLSKMGHIRKGASAFHERFNFIHRDHQINRKVYRSPLRMSWKAFLSICGPL